MNSTMSYGIRPSIEKRLITIRPAENLVWIRRNRDNTSGNFKVRIIQNDSKQQGSFALAGRYHGFEIRHLGRISRELFAMSRPINLIPSLLLGLTGSWMTANYNPRVLLMLPVWITSACSALIAAASMLVNDCYDHRSGVDEINQRNSALQNGEIDPSDVGLVAGCIYGGVMLATSCLEQPTIRLLITASAWITFIYTPLLKKVMLVKNIAVAGVIASSIVAGGLAVVPGSVTMVPRQTLASSFYLFLSIISREILMDVKDVEGDEAAGIRTIPVCFGEKAGRVAAVICALAANIFLVQTLWMLRSKSLYVASALSVLNLGMFLRMIVKLVVFSRDDLDGVISRDFMLALAVGVLTMAAK